MRLRILLLITLLLVTCAALSAQQPKPAPTATAAQQEEFQTALKVLQQAQAALRDAQAQNELAVTKLQNIIFKAMAENGIDPKKYEARLDQKTGNLTFTEIPKTTVAEKAPQPTTPKP